MRGFLVFCVLVLTLDTNAFAVRLRSREGASALPYRFYGACAHDLSKLFKNGNAFVGPLIPIAEGTLHTSSLSAIPGSGRFRTEGGSLMSGPNNFGVMNTMHLSVFTTESEAKSCTDAPYFTVRTDRIVDVVPTPGEDFMPSAERASWCFDIYTNLSRKPATLCTTSRQKRRYFMNHIKTVLSTRIDIGADREPLSDEEMEEMAKRRVSDYFTNQGSVASDEDLPQGINQSRPVVFPPAAKSICAFSGSMCLSSAGWTSVRGDGDGSRGESVFVVTAPPRWAASYPRPIASRRQRWSVMPVGGEDAEGGIQICSEEEWIAGGACIALPQGTMTTAAATSIEGEEEEGAEGTEAATSGGSGLSASSTGTFYGYDCRSQALGEQQDNCFALIEQIGAEDEVASRACQQNCEKEDECTGWVFERGDDADMPKCCILKDANWKEQCAKDDCCVSGTAEGHGTGVADETPTKADDQETEEEEDEGPTALNTAGNATVGNVIFVPRNDKGKDGRYQIWALEVVEESNAARISIADGDSSLCLTTGYVDPSRSAEVDDESGSGDDREEDAIVVSPPRPTSSRVWLSTCTEESDENEPDVSQLWIFTGFGMGGEEEEEESEASEPDIDEENLRPSETLQSILSSYGLEGPDDEGI